MSIYEEICTFFLIWFYVVNCYFYSITYSSGNGAAIYLSKSGVHFLVEFSTFVECSTTGSSSYGGGLYISNADFAMNHVCAIECKSSHRSSFTYAIGSTSRTVNSIHHSSIAYCFAENSYTMYHSYGYIDIRSVNLSHNTATQYSALVCQPSSIKDNIGTSISYSSFADNNATSQYCIYLNYNSDSADEYKISNSNIIRNSGDQTIYVYGTATFSNTCIMENKDLTNVFYIGSSSKCTLIDCSIDNTQKTGSGSLDKSSIGSNSFINGLTFISTGDCKNIFDTIDNIPLTGVVQRTPERTPDQTPSQTKNNFQNTCAEYLIISIFHCPSKILSLNYEPK